MLKPNNTYLILFLLVVVVSLFVAVDGIRIAQFPPRSVHAFRQGDCLAYTKTYYQHNSSFFLPATYNLIGEEGKVASEFPILYYLSAKLCRILGFNYWILRGVTFLCYVIGLCYLFLCVRFWIKNPLLALFPVLVLATSPFYYYYAVNYLPNVPAISFSFVALYYFIRYRTTFSRWHLIWSIIFFVLSILLKPTDGGLIWVSCTFIAAMYYFNKKAQSKKYLFVLIGSAFVGCCFVAWYIFTASYNAKYGNTINLQGIFPIWEMTEGRIVYTFNQRIIDVWLSCFQHPALLFVLCQCLIVFVVKWRRVDSFLRSFTLVLIIGAAAYSLLWYQAFDDHDYYLLLMTIPAVFVCVSAISYCEEFILPRVGKDSKYAVYIVLVGLLVISVYHNKFIIRERYAEANIGITNPAVFEVEPFLREKGIAPDDIVLSVPDHTPNITLAAFGNPGFSSDLFEPGRFSVEYCKERGAKYLIITEEKYINDARYKPYTNHLIGTFKGIYIYDIR